MQNYVCKKYYWFIISLYLPEWNSYNISPAGKNHQQRSAQLEYFLDSFLDKVSTTRSARINKGFCFNLIFNVK